MAGPGPYGSVGTDYREMQAPEQVDTDLPNNGAAERAAALGNVFQEFEGLSGREYNEIQTHRGSLAGAAAGATGHPHYREGLASFTSFGEAYNNAATGAYAIEAEAQADDTAARLRVQANNNPNTFRATFSAARDAVLKNAPAMAVPMLTELYNRHLAEGLAAISGDQAAQQKQLQAQTYEYGIQRQTSRVANLQSSVSPQDQLAAQDEQVKLSLQIDGGVKSGLYSEAEAQAMHINAMRTITGQVFETQVDRELADPNGDVMALLDRFRQAHIDNLSDPKQQPVLSEPEFQELMQNATTKIREYRLTEELARASGNTAQEARFEAGDSKYTALVLQGQATEKDLAAAVVSGDLKPETARSLRGLMMEGAHQQPKSDPRALFHLESDPNFLDLTTDQIAGYPGVNSIDALKAWQEQQRRLGSWEGTQAVKDAKGAITAALKIPPGTPTASLSDDERRALVTAQQDFVTRMNKIDPAHRDGAAAGVAQAVVGDLKKQDMQDQITAHQQNKQSMLQIHGPGSSEPWDAKKLQQYMSEQDQAITLLQRQLSGK